MPFADRFKTSLDDGEGDSGSHQDYASQEQERSDV